jgi:hypothetical protein
MARQYVWQLTPVLLGLVCICCGVAIKKTLQSLLSGFCGGTLVMHRHALPKSTKVVEISWSCVFFAWWQVVR